MSDPKNPDEMLYDEVFFFEPPFFINLGSFEAPRYFLANGPGAHWHRLAVLRGDVDAIYGAPPFETDSCWRHRGRMGAWSEGRTWGF